MIVLHHCYYSQLLVKLTRDGDCQFIDMNRLQTTHFRRAPSLSCVDSLDSNIEDSGSNGSSLRGDGPESQIDSLADADVDADVELRRLYALDRLCDNRPPSSIVTTSNITSIIAVPDDESMIRARKFCQAIRGFSPEMMIMVWYIHVWHHF